MDPVKRSSWRTGAVVTLVFVLGIATGVFSAHALQQRRLREIMLGDPAATRTRLTMFALERRLDLSPAQRVEAERLLRAQEGDYREAVEVCRPRVRELRRALVKDLEPILEPEQRALLEELTREQEQFR
jgi:hypothetical protein